MKELRVKGLASYPGCRSQVLLPQEPQSRMRFTPLRRQGGFVQKVWTLWFEACVEVQRVDREKKGR